MPKGGGGQAERDAALVREIAGQQAFRVDRLTEIVGRGSVNRVFVAASDTSRLVIRFPIDTLRDEFEIEEWCLAQAAAHGIASPQVVASGKAKGVPYLVQTFVSGAPGTDVRGAAAWDWLAHYGRIIRTIDVARAPDGLFSRFGRDMGAAWQGHLEYNAGHLSRHDPLLRLGVYAVDQQRPLATVIERLAAEPFDFGLLHGDLSLRNLIIRPGEPPVLIDWGTATTGPVPHAELLPLLRAHHQTGEPTVEEVSRFAAELGVPLPENRRTLYDLMLVQALDLVRWAIDRRPDRLDEVVRSSRALIQSPSML